MAIGRKNKIDFVNKLNKRRQKWVKKFMMRDMRI